MRRAGLELRLATLRNGSRDGSLVLVDRSHTLAQAVPDIAPSLQSALDRWAKTALALAARQAALDATGWAGAVAFDPVQAMAPLPRAYQWVDASCYRNHARLMYRWRNEPIPPRYEEEPLAYQGGSDTLLGPREPLVARSIAHEVDLEAEVGVITTDVPMGITTDAARDCIALVVLLNDVSLRGLIPGEVSRGFGFYLSKPATHFAPLAVTPAALGEAWVDSTLHCPVTVHINDRWLGSPNAGEELLFNFARVISHLAQTRSLAAGTIVGAGTISNADPATGSACITEARVRAMLDGEPPERLVPYLKHGDRIRIEAFSASGTSLFGAIDQSIEILPDAQPSGGGR